MARPKMYDTEAIVLRAMPLGEADRLLTLFTPGMGKLKATARGVRKVTSKLGGHLDLLTRSSLTLHVGKSLDTISSADALEAFDPVKRDLPRLSRAIYMSELMDAFNPLEVPNPAVYSLFVEGLRTLGTEADPDLILRYVELQLLKQTGFIMELAQCVECRGRVTPNDHAFSPRAGGILCSSCHSSYADARPISVDALKVLRFLSKSSMASAVAVRVKQPLHRELAPTMDSFVRYPLERELKSAAFLRFITQSTPQSAADVPAGVISGS